MAWKRIGTALGALTLVAVAPATAADAAPAADGGTDRTCVVVVDTGEASCGETRTDARAGLSTQATWTDIVSVYNGTGYTGTEVLFQTTGDGCSASYDREFEYRDLRVATSININNWISSVRTYNQCDVRLYDGLDFTGAYSTWIDRSSNLSYIGSGWNNRASSLKIS